MKKNITILCFLAFTICSTIEVQAQGDQVIGEIRMFAGNFAPRGWALCNGQLLAVSSNDALFSLIGTIYGGDGRTTFGLPDLRGRTVVHAGNGPGLSQRNIGSSGGSASNTFSTAQLPSHNHAISINSAEEGTTEDPNGSFVAGTGTLSFSPTSDGTMASPTVGNTGNNQSVNNMQPYGVVNYIIALTGIYPSRN
jgi:microcystin-dependent protein